MIMGHEVLYIVLHVIPNLQKKKKNKNKTAVQDPVYGQLSQIGHLAVIDDITTKLQLTPAYLQLGNCGVAELQFFPLFLNSFFFSDRKFPYLFHIEIYIPVSILTVLTT